MVFSSIEFIFRFLPIFFVLYFLTPKKYRNYIILAGSLVFYAYGEPIYVFLMIFSILINYWLAQKIDAANRLRRKNISKGKKAGRYLLVSCIYNLGVLFVFKYLNFFLSIINHIFQKELFPYVDLELPLGISFYTFQILAYVIDVYRGTYACENNLINFATYVCMFPQLIAGPIVNYQEVRKDMHKRRTDYKGVEWGVTLFTMGLIYKVLLANKIGCLWNDVQTVGVLGINTATAWLGSIGFSMQIFFDFFGYSLMAIGLGRMLGFNLPLNFNNPYCAKSATEFWRKWHITLGRWFREYVYIPLGGNRKGKLWLVVNTFVVWFLTGLWHGADWNFIIWGMFFFVLLMLEKFIYLPYLEKSKVLGHLYTIFWIPVSWTIFNISDLKLLGTYLRRMFFLPVKNSVVYHGAAQFFSFLGDYWWLLLVCVFCCTPYPLRWLQRFYKTGLCRILLFVLFWICIYEILRGYNNPFLYFRF